MRSLLPLLLLLPSLAVAQSVEYRTLELTDGRFLTGEVAESGAEGMLLRLEQGMVLVRYDQLAGMEVLDADAAKEASTWTVALAPTTGPAGERAEWLGSVVDAIPAVSWVRTDAWNAAAASCGGGLACLVGKAREIEADYLLLSVFDGTAGRMVLRGVHTAQGGVVGEAGLVVPEERGDALPALLGGVFTALGVRPEIDLMEAVGGESVVADEQPEPEPQPAPEPEPQPAPEPEPEPTAEPEPAPTAEPEPVATAEPAPAAEPEPARRPAVSLTSKPSGKRMFTRTRPGLEWSRSRGAAVALGFAPVPGLSSAYIGDVPGFVASMSTTVALSAVSIYTLGSTVRFKDPYLAASALVPYAINVIVNQIAGAIGWSRLYGTASVARRPAAGIAPVLAHDGTPQGATVVVGLTF